MSRGWEISPGNAVGRRRALMWGALAMPALAACDGGYDDSPDPLAAIAHAARSDAEAARRLSDGGPVARAVAEVRAAQAKVLDREVARANRPAPKPRSAPGITDLAGLGKRLAAARKQARKQLAAADAYRAGLLGSVIAGCAGAQALDPALGTIAVPAYTAPAISSEQDEQVVAALQEALAAEHAAIWVYGLVRAFLPDSYDKGIAKADDEHRARRDAAHTVIDGQGATPVLAEPAYRTPKPVTSARSATAVVIVAETDAAAAWHGLLVRTDDSGLRGLAVDALESSAVRATRWRADAGVDPPAIPLPGMD